MGRKKEIFNRKMEGENLICMKDKVLIVAQNGLNRGGIQSVIMEIVRNLSYKYTFDIVVFTSEVRYHEKEFLKFGGNIYRIPHDKSPFSVIRRAGVYYRGRSDFIAITNVIKEKGPYKAIHCNNGYESALALTAAMNNNIPVRITHAHILREESRRFFRRRLDTKYKEIMLKTSTHRIGCSSKACMLMYGEATNWSVVVNPYDKERFNPELYCTPHFNAPVLIQIGNFSSLKNQLFTLKVFSKVVEKYSDAFLHLVGFDVDGYKMQIEEEIKKLGIANNTKLYPSDADTPYLLSKSSYLLQPSLTEAFGIVLVEAQAMGLRCYVSDVTPEESNAGGCNYLSICEDPEIWANVLLADFETTKGRHRVYDTSRYSMNNLCEIYDRIYSGEI